MTTYGIYTDDLKAWTIQGMYTVEDCKKWCRPGYVICMEKDCTYGCEVMLAWHSWATLKLSLRFKRLELGWITISWAWRKYKTADKVVWRPKQKEGGAK